MIRIDRRYWVAMLTASVLGVSFGDFIAKVLKLGHAGALLPCGLLLAVSLLVRARRTTEAWYWAAVVSMLATTTSIGDSLSHVLHLGNGTVSAALASLLAISVIARRSGALMRATTDATPGIAPNQLQAAGTRYWSLMLIAGSFGTPAGDLVADSLGLGTGWGSVVLLALLASLIVFDRRAKCESEARYWLIVAVLCIAGTTIADFVNGDDGLNLGLSVGTIVALMGLAVVLLFAKIWAAAQQRWPVSGAIWGVARNDLAVWLRSPAAIAAALLPALGMGVLVAMLTASVGRQPVALVVEGEGRLAARMARLINADKDAYLLERMSAADAGRAFAEQRVAAAIVIPADFDSHVAHWDASVHLYLNNVNIDIADDLRRAVTRSVAEFDAPQLGLLGELHGPSKGLLLPNPYRIAVAERDVRETEVSLLQYQVIPIILLVVISVGLLGTALLTARDFDRGTAKIMVLSPVGRLPLVLCRLLGGALITASLVVPLIAVGFMTRSIPYCHEESGGPLWLTLLLSGLCGWMLPVPPWSHALALLALLIAVTLTAVGLGTLLGVWLRDAKIVTMAGLNAAAYLFFLGGGFTTVAFLPEWIQTVSRIVPTSYAINGLRQALFYPDLLGFGRDLAALLVCATIAALLASLALTRAWRRT